MLSKDVTSFSGVERPVIRYLNLRYLVESMADGNISAFADLVGKTRTNVARYGGKNYNHDSAIGERWARDIEDALELGRGWMDTIHQLPKEVPAELLALLQGAKGRLSNDVLKARVDGTFPVVDSVMTAGLIDGKVEAGQQPIGYMMATIPSARGYYLKVDDNAYAPSILPGMLLQVDPDRRPTVEEVTSRPVFVVLTRDDVPHAVVRLVHQMGDLQLYGPVNGDIDNDPTPYVDPDEWDYGGMVVMRLIP